MIEEGVVLTQKCRLRIVVELIKSNDIRRPVNRLYPKEVCATEQLYRNIVKKKMTKFALLKSDDAVTGELQ